VRKPLKNLWVLLVEMGKSFKRNSEDSYKYGGNKRPKPKKRNNPKRQNETQGQDKDWRRVFEEINAVVRDDNGKSPNRD
jgi:hypothetical protein